MTKKNWLLIVTALALAAVYVVYFTGWFRPAPVQIFHTTRSPRPRAANPHPAPALFFGLNHPLRLTEIKVVPLAEWQADNKVLPLWHLISASNSVPVKIFTYGQRISGLQPAVPGDRPQPLATNVLYRLFVTAGQLTGQHDFELK